MKIKIVEQTPAWAGVPYLTGQPVDSPYPDDLKKHESWISGQTLTYFGIHKSGDIIEAVTKYENGLLIYIDESGQVGFPIPESSSSEPSMEDVFNAAENGMGHQWVAAVLWWKGKTEKK